jgi:hypothetical protein
MKVAEAIDLFAKRKEQGQARGNVLIETAEFIELLEALFDFKVTAKTLKMYASPRVKLLPAAVKKDGKSCYVYPDQLDRIGFTLALRQTYHLPLNSIRELNKHFPADARHLVLERKMTIEELLDLAKMMPRGFAVKDLVMAKTCDLMVQDTLSPSRALFAAVEPGEALRKAEEGAILSRLDELKQWVVSGRGLQESRPQPAPGREDREENHSQARAAAVGPGDRDGPASDGGRFSGLASGEAQDGLSMGPRWLYPGHQARDSGPL